jgi:hypothetical protein
MIIPFVIKTVLAQRGQHNFLSYWPEVGTLAHRKGKRRGGVDLTFKEKKTFYLKFLFSFL